MGIQIPEKRGTAVPLGQIAQIPRRPVNSVQSAVGLVIIPYRAGKQAGILRLIEEGAGSAASLVLAQFLHNIFPGVGLQIQIGRIGKARIRIDAVRLRDGFLHCVHQTADIVYFRPGRIFRAFDGILVAKESCLKSADLLIVLIRHIPFQQITTRQIHRFCSQLYSLFHSRVKTGKLFHILIALFILLPQIVYGNPLRIYLHLFT